MRTSVRLTLFALTLVTAFVAALGLGRATGPVGPSAAAEHAEGQHGAAVQEGEQHGGSTVHVPASGTHGGSDAEHADGGEPLGVTGLSVTEGGYRLDLQTTTLPLRQAAPLRLRVLREDGTPLQDYTRTHDKEMHLVVVRRDTQHFQHVHPERDAAGTWTVPLTLPAAGDYKLFADFSPADAKQAIALVADVRVAGRYEPQPLPPPAPTTTGGGYSVEIDGDLVAGKASPVSLTLSRNGTPVTDLEPYLGAFGHVVVLREGDLAYLHVHPRPGGPGPRLTFDVDVATPGTYRLFLDFQHDGRVRTAPFTVTTSGARS